MAIVTVNTRAALISEPLNPPNRTKELQIIKGNEQIMNTAHDMKVYLVILRSLQFRTNPDGRTEEERIFVTMRIKVTTMMKNVVMFRNMENITK